MKLFARILIALAAILCLAAIWIPEHWWQLLLTALLAFFAGGAILGGPKRK